VSQAPVADEIAAAKNCKWMILILIIRASALQMPKSLIFRDDLRYQ
jgi:hypothetical protein